MILDQAFRYITELKKQNDAMLLDGGDKVQGRVVFLLILIISIPLFRFIVVSTVIFTSPAAIFSEAPYQIFICEVCD